MRPRRPGSPRSPPRRRTSGPRNVDGHEGAAIGLVLTGGYRPRDAVIAAIRQADLFATLVREDTYTVASEVHDLLVKTHPADHEKIELIKALVAEHLDIERILAVATEAPGRLIRDRQASRRVAGFAPPGDRPGRLATRARRSPTATAERGEDRQADDREPDAGRRRRLADPDELRARRVDVAVPDPSPAAASAAGAGAAGARTSPEAAERRPSSRLVFCATSSSIWPRVSVSCFWTARTSSIFAARAMIAWRAASVARRLAIRAPRSTT